MTFHRVRQTSNGDNVYIVNESGKNRACHITNLRQGCGQSQMLTRQTRLNNGEIAQYRMKFYCQKTDRYVESHAEMIVPKRFCRDTTNLEQIKGQVVAKMQSWHRDAAQSGRHSPHHADDRDFDDRDGTLRYSGHSRYTEHAKRSHSTPRQSQKYDSRTLDTSQRVRRSQSLVDPSRKSTKHQAIQQVADRRTGQQSNRYFMAAQNHRACPISGERHGCGSSRIMNASTASRRASSVDFSVSFHCKSNELGGVSHHAIVQVAQKDCSSSKLEQVEQRASQMINSRLSKGKCIGREDGAGRRSSLPRQIESEDSSSDDSQSRGRGRGRSRYRRQPTDSEQKRAYTARRQPIARTDTTESTRFGGKSYRDTHAKPQIRQRPLAVRKTDVKPLSTPNMLAALTGHRGDEISTSKSAKPLTPKTKALSTPNMLAALGLSFSSSKQLIDSSSSEDELPSTSKGVHYTAKKTMTQRGYQRPNFPTQAVSSEESDSD